MKLSFGREQGVLPPTGTVTFLYTDIEGSSRLLESQPERMPFWHDVHNRHLTEAISAHHGFIYRVTGDGFCAAFQTSGEALMAAMQAQRTLRAEAWDDDLTIQVRMAIFAGPAEFRGNDYVGRTLNRGSRLLNAAHGGQTVLNSAAFELLPDRTLPGIEIVELGQYVLQGGLQVTDTIYQAVPEGFDAIFPPLHHHKGAVSAHRVRSDKTTASESRPFFGRSRELRDLKRLLASRELRLVTVTGLGGMGKTRLAAELARNSIACFPDGIFFVPCETIQGQQELAASIAAAVSRRPVGEAEQAAVTALDGKRALLVLDCFESLVVQKSLVDRLLASTTTFKILMTSRWPVGLGREVEYPLGPLEVPSQSSRKSAAVRLFLNAATYADPKTRRSNAELPIIERICERVEGVPLAIQIAAGCLKWCPLSKLEDVVNTDLLDIELADDRRATLRNIIAASVRALRGPDREFLQRLIMFRSEFDVADVCSVLKTTRAAAVSRLARLRDYSLVQAPLAEGRLVFHVLHTVREALADKATASLESSTIQEDSRRHLTLFIAKAMRVRRLMGGGTTSEESDWILGTGEMLRYMADFRAAFAMAVAQSDSRAVCDLARALARTALELGLWEDFENWTALAEPRARETRDWALLMSVLGLKGARAQRSNDLEAARVCWSAFLELAESVGDQRNIADAHFDLANLAMTRGDFTSVAEHLKPASKLANELADSSFLALVMAYDAILACEAGNPKMAESYARSAVAQGANQQSQHSFFFTSLHGARVLRRTGHIQEARLILERMLAAARSGRKIHEAARSFVELGELHVEAGDLARAGLAHRGASLLLGPTSGRLRAETDKLQEELSASISSTDQLKLNRFLKHRPQWDDVALALIE